MRIKRLTGVAERGYIALEVSGKENEVESMKIGLTRFWGFPQHEVSGNITYIINSEDLYQFKNTYKCLKVLFKDEITSRVSQ